MLQYLVRFAKRLAVLLPGLAIGYVSVRNIYPALDSHAPAVLAFLVTYILAAYLLIPAIGRFFRLFRKSRHLPVYSVTPDGYASDPVNIGVIGSRRQLIAAMQRAGWDEADGHSPSNIWREIVCSLLRVPYPAAPMSNLYLFGRRQDLAFEIQIETKWWHRHHVRFWATTYDDGFPAGANSIHWFGGRGLDRYGFAGSKSGGRGQSGDDDRPLLWLGAATKDVGLAFIKHNAQLTHMIHPDTDSERDLIVDQLRIDGAQEGPTLEIMKPYTLANRAWRGYLRTDGQLKIVRLT